MALLFTHTLEIGIFCSFVLISQTLRALRGAGACFSSLSPTNNFLLFLLMYPCSLVKFFPCMMCAKSLSTVRLPATPWTVARQAPLSMGFSRKKYWSGSSCPPSGDLPDPGIEPKSHVPCIGDGFFTTSATGKPKFFSHIQVQMIFISLQYRRQPILVVVLGRVETKIKTKGLLWCLSGKEICLSIQGTQVQSLIQEGPTCCGAVRPLRHNYWSLRALEPVLHSKRSCCPEKPEHCN